MSVATQNEALLCGIDIVILAGGLGTRLRAAVPDRQKVLVEVGGQPFLAKLVDFYAALGAGRIILTLGHRASDVEAFMRTYGAHGPELVASVEPEPRGTGGALRHALPLIHSPTCVVANGDSFALLDFRNFLQLHREKRAAITLALSYVADTRRYGLVECDPAGHVQSFREKSADLTGPGFISAGIYLMQREVIATLPAAMAISLEREVFPKWVGRGLYGLGAPFPFIDIGTPEALREADEFFAGLKGKVG